VTRRYPEVWPMCFNHSPFAIRHSLFSTARCSPLAARPKIFSLPI